MYSYRQWCEILRDERLPIVVVDLDAFDRNIDTLAGFLKGKSKVLRLATKSVRVPELIKRVLAQDRIFQGLMCFAAEEAEWLAAEGFDDLLVAYPTVRPTDLAALRRLHEAGKKICLIVDSDEGARLVAAGMKGCARPFRVALDIDASLRYMGGLAHVGVRRSPLRSEADIERMIDVVAGLSELKLVGAMAYEAQVAGLGDRNPFKRLLNPIFAIVRALSVRAVAAKRARVAALFARKGVTLELFNGGGTGSMNYAAEEAALTELSAGSGLLCSHLFDYYSNVHFEPACFFALQASRVPDPGYVTCLGGGYVASGEPGWDKVPRVYLPAGAKLLSAEGTGEVQTPVKLPPGTKVNLGDPIFFRHAKAGELAERFNEFLLVSQGKIISRTKTYRGEGLSFF